MHNIYNIDGLEQMLETAAYNYGYNYTAWVRTNTREDREAKAFAQGRASVLAELYDTTFKQYLLTPEGSLAYSRGEESYDFY